MSDGTSVGPAGTAPSTSGAHGGPTCALTTWVLRVLALVLFVFGWAYLLAPGTSVSAIQSLANGIGLHLPVAPDADPTFYAWVGFTFAYMMAATACCLLASRTVPERRAYLHILLVLKGTSSLVGLGLFVGTQHYAFYLSTFLVDGLLFLLVLFLLVHLTRHHTSGVAPASSAA